MNRFSLYTLLVLIYLGISKSYSPQGQSGHFVENERVFSNFFQGAPLTVILIDSFQKGFLIKTYYQKYLVFNVFNEPENLVVRTSRPFWKKNLPNLGLSLFSRRESDSQEFIIPSPPGSLFVGDPSYGYWESDDSGRKVWFFHRPYRHFPQVFKWGDFRPDDQFFNLARKHQEQSTIFYGSKSEFGKDGTITSKLISEYHGEQVKIKTQFKNHLKKYLAIPQRAKE